MQVVFGQESGFDLIKTLHFPLALGIVNSTMRPKPSSFKDSAALEYSGFRDGSSRTFAVFKTSITVDGSQRKKDQVFDGLKGGLFDCFVTGRVRDFL